MINVEGYEIPNKVTELTVSQFDQLNQININTELENFEKWMEKFIYLGVDESVFESMDVPTFRKYVEDFNNVGEVPEDKTLSFEIEGFTYVASETIGIKDMSLIEKAWRKDRSNFSLDVMSILYKREDLTKAEHYSDAHIKHKKKLFKDVKIGVAYPFIIEVLKLLVKQTEENNEPTEELESNNG